MTRFVAVARALVAICLMAASVCVAQPKRDTFATAWEDTKKAIDAMQAARSSAGDLRTRLGQESDPNVRAELQKKLDEEVKSATRIKLDLAKRAEAALKLVEATTAIDDVNRLRYLQCYLKYEDGEYLQAGEIGELVAMKYPGSDVARPCAKIALASYLNLYKAKKVGAAKVSALANQIVATWPNHPDTAIARDILRLTQ